MQMLLKTMPFFKQNYYDNLHLLTNGENSKLNNLPSVIILKITYTIFTNRQELENVFYIYEANILIYLLETYVQCAL